MKKIILITIALCAAFSASAFCLFAVSSQGKHLRGSGKIVTRTMDTPQFDKIDVSRAVKVLITDNASDKITIVADDNLIDLVVVEATKGKLKITVDQNHFSVQDINVTVTIPITASNLIRSLKASSASSINSKVVLSAPEFSIEALDAASISVAVKTTKCEIKASSAASIKLKGSAKICNATLSSASQLAANNFVVENYSIKAASASEATINCSSKLTASASSIASINYRGDATNVTISKSIDASVRRK